MPSCIEEYDKLEYIQTDTVNYEDRFFPINGQKTEEDIKEKSKLNYFPDEYGFLSVYRVKLTKESKRSVPNNLIYVGNYLNAKPPHNEFIPHSKLNINALSWKKFNSTFEQDLIQSYYWHNLKEAKKYKNKIETQGNGSSVCE